MKHIYKKNALLVLLVCVNLVYFLGSANLTCSNDGSHFALVSAIAEEGTVEIGDFLGYTRMIDYCLKDGKYYSDRPPGLALMSLPFYAAGILLRQMHISRFLSARENISEVFVMFLPNIAGTVVVLLMFLFCKQFGLDSRTGIITVFLCAFTTPVWIESTRFFSHQLSMMLVFAAAYAAVIMKKIDQAGFREVLRVSVLLSLACIVEIQNILFAGAFLFYLVLAGKIRTGDFRNPRVRLLMVTGILSFAVMYAMLFVYNGIAFQQFTLKSNLYNPVFPEERGLFTSLSGNVLSGLDRLFTNFTDKEIVFNWTKGIRNLTPGIFVLAPVFLVSAAGWYQFFREKRKEALFFLLIILSSVLLVSMHKTVLTRHISTIIPFLFFPVAFPVRNALMRLRSGRNFIGRWWLISVILILACVSAARIFYVMNTFWGRSLSAPFPFIGEMRSYAFFYGLVAVLYLSGKKKEVS